MTALNAAEPKNRPAPPAGAGLLATRAARLLSMAVLSLVAGLAIAALGGTAAASPVAAQSLPDPNSAEQEFWNLLNQTRADHGLPALQFDPVARDKVARGWSATMGSQNSLYHNPNLASEVSSRVTSEWTRLGENVGVGSTVSGLHAAFFNSPPHRANMLGDFNRVGVGVVNTDRIWVTFVFIKGPSLQSVQGAGSLDGACRGAPVSGFPDRPSGEAGLAVDCMAYLSITSGQADGLYGSNNPVTRGQMATFLIKTLDALGTPAPSPASGFRDTRSSVHDTSIRRMVAAGITSGYSDGTYRPDNLVSRAQMATFLRRMIEYSTGRTMRSGPDAFFDDNRSVHEASINALADAGIVSGRAPGEYSPGSAVTRRQMAQFLARSIGWIG